MLRRFVAFGLVLLATTLVTAAPESIEPIAGFADPREVTSTEESFGAALLSSGFGTPEDAAAECLQSPECLSFVYLTVESAPLDYLLYGATIDPDSEQPSPGAWYFERVPADD